MTITSLNLHQIALGLEYIGDVCLHATKAGHDLLNLTCATRDDDINYVMRMTVNNATNPTMARTVSRQFLDVYRVATGQGKVREIQGQGKVRESCNWSGKFGILRKVREFWNWSGKFDFLMSYAQ